MFTRNVCRLLLTARTDMLIKPNVAICTSTVLNRFRKGVFPTDLEDLSGLILKEESPLNKEVSHRYDTERYTTNNPHCYNTINFEVHGYDLVLVEKFTQNIHRFLKHEKVHIEEVYELPTTFKAVKYLGETQSFAFEENRLETVAELPVHYRIVQVTGVKSNMLPLYLQKLSLDAPSGVGLSLKEYTEEEHKFRFKENDELIKLKQELAELVATK